MKRFLPLLLLLPLAACDHIRSENVDHCVRKHLSKFGGANMDDPAAFYKLVVEKCKSIYFKPKSRRRRRK